MPEPIPTCAECGGPMSPGFVMDETSGGRHPSLWVEGEHEKSVWVGTKLSGRAIWVTEGLRCEGCGALRLYARRRKR